MNDLTESLKSLRSENITIKEEIFSYLDNLTQYSKNEIIENATCLTELFKHEQQINHKLTEIKFDLIKFKNFNKIPEGAPCKIEKNDHNVSSSYENDEINIEELKETSMKIIEKLDKYYGKNEPKKTYPYLSEKTLKNLSEHTKNKLYEDIKRENGCGCEQYKDLKEKLPNITKSCDINDNPLNLDVFKTKLNEIIDENREKTENERSICDGNSNDINLIDCSLQYLENLPRIPFESNEKDNECFVDTANLLDLDSDVDVKFEKNAEPSIEEATTYAESECDTIDGITEFYMEKNEITNSDENVDINEDTPTTNDIESVPVEVKKPTLEEKIRKLGLENRYTIYERSRPQMTLPDLRLQPSISDNEKLRMLNHEMNNNYVIANHALPQTNDLCMFSHVETPNEFYIQLKNEETDMLDCLNAFITRKFKGTQTPYRSKIEACENIERFCCAYIKKDKIYYRAEIVDWLFEKGTKIVLVQLVDYGYLEYVHYKHLRDLSEELASLPKMAVKCYLPLLYPPGSTRWKILDTWPVPSVEALRELGGLTSNGEKPVFRLIHVEKYDDDGTLGVDMYDINNNPESPPTIGEVMINLGHAVQIILPEDDPTNIIDDDLDIEHFENCNNLNEVVLGYDPKDEARICPLKRLKNGLCFKGTNCKLEHTDLPQDGYTTDKELVCIRAENTIKLPGIGQNVKIKFTRALNASHYYINFSQFEKLLEKLENLINDKRNIAKYETYKILPAVGEIVVAKHWTQRWLRAKVRHHVRDDDCNRAQLQVFMVDHGDIVDVPLKDVRKIRKDFVELPFQAIECVLYNYKTKNDITEKDVDTFFHENMFHREFSATVMGICDDILCLKVFHQNSDIGEILEKLGFLVGMNTSVLPNNAIIMVPG